MVLALALAGDPGAAEIPGPGVFPDCPDPESVAIAYRDELTGTPSLLRPESLLYGRIELWPTARRSGHCDAASRRPAIAFTLNYAPIPAQAGSGVHTVNVGSALQGNLIALELSAGAGGDPPITRRVWTLDASIQASAKRSVGERVEETQEVRAGPPDRVTFNIAAFDEQGAPVTDLSRGDLSIDVEHRRLGEQAILDIVAPSPRIPIRLLIALDVSMFLEQGKPHAQFNERYEAFVDQAIMAGLDSLVRHVMSRGAPVPPVEIGLVRYALSAQWLEDPFWRADAGLPETRRRSLRDFLLSKPNPSWLATGQADADATLNALRRLWHYFDGRRAILVLPRGAEVFTGRRQQAFLPPEVEHGPPSIEDAAADILGGGSGPVERILQHTERRYPTVSALMPAAVSRGRGHDWIRHLADATGGVTLWEDDDLPERFLELLNGAFDTLGNAHMVTLEIANDEQQPRWKKIAIASTREGVEIKAPRLYQSSGDICHYVASYLLTEDPVTRLVAANEAAKCRRVEGLQGFLQSRLHDRTEREDHALVREEIFRSYIELTFRLLQSTTGKDRRAVRENLARTLEREEDAALAAAYTAIADRLLKR